ncbi:ubiquitin-related modifier (inferred from BLASTP similarity) [Trypanosoma grayi]|uniref:ubiquitin-related modifier (inferred from BLASTP similarity) n=1 Tax=Trypanosoma grayi TaxID=71804 RepID=UPI0004F48D69|nr:ubiquitin-related modifier (inferred from BLASTP similarity) [Trypanosoma grayi]KEG14138.1 ubiquitin-related modifier (inferred from BLASTP similarity) [Trypanosoma grayi]
MSCHQRITVQFAGGCELLFDKQTALQLDGVVPHEMTVNGLVQLLKADYVKERPDLFVDPTGTALRPGILVLVNACDADVLGGSDYVLCDGDTIEFISTLHGG